MNKCRCLESISTIGMLSIMAGQMSQLIVNEGDQMGIGLRLAVRPGLQQGCDPMRLRRFPGMRGRHFFPRHFTGKKDIRLLAISVRNTEATPSPSSGKEWSSYKLWNKPEQTAEWQ